MTEKFTQLTPTREIRKAEIRGLVLTEFYQASGLSIPRHAHESATILCVYQGRVADQFRSSVHECKTSSILVRPAEEFHSHRYGDGGTHCLAIQIGPAKIASITPFSRVLDGITHLRSARLSSLALLIRSELEIMDDASPLAIEGLVLEMLALTMRLSQRTMTTDRPKWLSDAKDLIHQHYFKQMNLSDIAQVAGVHPAHLAESFRKHFHCTIGQYIRNLRLDYAIRELTQTQKPFKEIALAAGFYDHSHLTNTLKRDRGFTPTEIRLLSGRPKSATRILRPSKD